MENEDKPSFKKIFFYSEDFVDEIKKFKRLIALDDDNPCFDNLKNKHQRFSAAIRGLISRYNKSKEVELLHGK